MTYPTPTTKAEFTALIDAISWPISCEQEEAAAVVLVEQLEAFRLGLELLNPVRLYLVSTESPTLADWQTAWKDQGRTLPITGKVFGLWENNDGLSADYIWLDGDMQPMMAYWWNGSSQFISSVPSDYSNTVALSTTESIQVSQTLTLDRAAYIEAVHPATRNETTTTVQWRLGTDAVNSTRGILAPNGAASAPKIGYFRGADSTKVSSGTATKYFRTISGTGTLLFTNNAVTRKIETGAYPYFLGETNAVMTEAIYL